MDQRYGAWAQLLVLFRIIHDGARHGDFQIPGRKGYLFDPDRYPFLEGRPRGIPTNCQFLLDYEEDEDEDDDPSAAPRARSRKKPWRYRWPDDIRDEVLARLLDLNAKRAEEERIAGQAADAPGKRAGRAAKGRKNSGGKNTETPSLWTESQ